MTAHIAGWRVHPASRAQLLRMCPATHPIEHAHYVVLQPVPAYAPVPPEAQVIVRGMFDDGAVQALVVMVNGIVTRPQDDMLFHLMMSCQPGIDPWQVGPRMRAQSQLVHEIDPWPVFTHPVVEKVNG